MASKYVDIVKDALKVSPFKYGTAIGEALKSGVGINEEWAKSGYRGAGPLRGPLSSGYGGASGPGGTPGLAGGTVNIPAAEKKISDVT